ncbi:MAG: hypothetical protein R3B55_02570 [Candidatus Paceibacterota bacterium]
MNYFKKYIEYLKDNPKGYWFKRKIYGWGWTPARWQGWVVIVLYIALILILVTSREEYIPGNDMSGSNFLTFAFPIILLTIFLLVVVYKKGEPPKWTWGLKDSDKNKEE